MNSDVHQAILLLTTLFKSLRINDFLALAVSSQWMMRELLSVVWVCVCGIQVLRERKQVVYHVRPTQYMQSTPYCKFLTHFLYYSLLSLAAMTHSFHIVYTNVPPCLWHIVCRHNITNHIRYIFNTALQQHGFLKSFQVDISVHVAWLCSIRLFITSKLLLSCHS